jgi:hypothetical protein
MAKPSAKSEPTGYPEFAVRAETICQFFSPLLASSTFYDLVNKGRIIPLKGIRGFYKLNESLRLLGLREVPSLPEVASRSTEDIVRLAFSAIDPDVFPAPSWLLNVEAIDGKGADHAERIIAQHVDAVMALGSDREKQHYFQSALDASAMMEADRSAESAEG